MTTKNPNPIVTQFQEALELRNRAKNEASKVPQQTSSPISSRHAEEALAFFDNSITILQKIVVTLPKLASAHFYLSLILYEKETALGGTTLISSTEQDNLIKLALEYIETAAGLSPENADIWTLWAQLILEKANVILKRTNPNFTQYESLLLQGSEKLTRALDIQNEHKYAKQLLSKCMDELVNSNKDRNRTGFAVYHIAGEFIKEGGSVKNWKTRWFVVDDSCIAYYKDKADWEKGPVKGAPAKPQGTISFSEVLDISGHDEPSKCSNIAHRPKSAQGLACLHILTQTRTYNIVGFESRELQQQWLQVLKNILRLYNVKKKAKKLTRDKSKQDASISSLEMAFEEISGEIEMLESGRKTGIPINNRKDSSKTPPSPGSLKSNSLTRSASDLSGSSPTNSPNINGTTGATASKAVEVKEISPETEEVKEIELDFQGDHSDDFGFKITGDLTSETFFRGLRDMDNESALQYTKSLLKQYQSEGLLAKVVFEIIKQDPKQFLANVCDVSNFNIAKFGGLRRIEKIMEEESDV